jgi:carbon storage regulator CsrA
VLNLNRYLGERIQIGPDVVVVVREIRGANGGKPMVKLGIEAPAHVSIRRSELEVLNDKWNRPAESEREGGGRPPLAGHLPGVEVAPGLTTDAFECQCGRGT